MKFLLSPPSLGSYGGQAALFLIFLALASLLPAAPQNSVAIPCPVPVAAGGVTNLALTPFSGIDLDGIPPSRDAVGISVRFLATSATGGTATVRFVVTYDGTNWTDAASSLLVLSASVTNAPVTVGDGFGVWGARRIAVGSVSNACGGMLTGLLIRLNWPVP